MECHHWISVWAWAGPAAKNAADSASAESFSFIITPDRIVWKGVTLRFVCDAD
jgi:uncharacterized membrane-anchored protein